MGGSSGTLPPNLRSKEISLDPALVFKASEEDVVASRENRWEHSSGARIWCTGGCIDMRCEEIRGVFCLDFPMFDLFIHPDAW